MLLTPVELSLNLISSPSVADAPEVTSASEAKTNQKDSRLSIAANPKVYA